MMKKCTPKQDITASFSKREIVAGLQLAHDDYDQLYFICRHVQSFEQRRRLRQKALNASSAFDHYCFSYAWMRFTTNLAKSKLDISAMDENAIADQFRTWVREYYSSSPTR